MEEQQMRGMLMGNPIMAEWIEQSWSHSGMDRSSLEEKAWAGIREAAAKHDILKKDGTYRFDKMYHNFVTGVKG